MLTSAATIVLVVSFVLGAAVGGAGVAWPGDVPGYVTERPVGLPLEPAGPGAAAPVPGTGLQADSAVVLFSDQASDGRSVAVARAHLPKGGFVSVHDETLRVRGTSSYLEPGSHSGVVVRLDDPITRTRTLVAVLYTDTNGNEQYDFVRSRGAEDGPYVSDSGEPVTDDATVTVGFEDQERNVPPAAVLTYDPPDPHPGQWVEFDSAGSADEDGRIVRYDWRVESSDPATLVRYDDSDDTISHLFGDAGTYEVSLTVTDDGGATDTASVTVVVRENEPPVAAFAFTPAGPRPAGTVVFDAVASRDPDGAVVAYDWTVRGPARSPVDSFATDLPALEHTFGEPGEYEVSLTVTDDDGARTTRTTTVVVRENEPPVAALAFAPADPAVGEAVGFDGTLSSDDRGVVSYLWDLDGDGQFEAEGSRVARSFDAVGRYPVTLLVVDGDDATDRTTRAVVVSAANVPPVAAFALSPAAPDAGERVDLDGSASFDPDGSIELYRWEVDGAFVGDGNTPRFFDRFPAPGSYAVTLTVTDDRGATGTTTEEVVVGDDTRPPSAAIAFSPEVPLVDALVTFDATGSTDDGEISLYRWDLDGDGAFEADGQTVERRYATAGTFVVSLIVVDDDGETDAANTTVRVNAPPEPAFRVEPASPVAGERATLDASDSTDDRRIAAYEWDLDGDGEAEATGRVVRHAFEGAGERTVGLSVTDGDGVTASVTQTVTVAAPRTPTGTPTATPTPTTTPTPTVTATPTPGSGNGSTLGDLLEDLVGPVSPSDAVVAGGTAAAAMLAVWFRDELLGALRDLRLPRRGRTTPRGGRRTRVSREVPDPDETEEDDEEPNRPPTASVRYTPEEPTVGRPVLFDGLGSLDTDGRVTAYRWSGDGPERGGATAVHTFEEDGEHEVTLTVEDDDGATGETTVTVEVDPGEGELELVDVHPDSPGRDHESLHLEYLVFGNVGGGPLDVAGWTVHDAAEEEERVREGEHTYAFEDGLELAPDATVTLHTGAEPENEPTVDADEAHHRYWGRTWPVWNNEGDIVVVKDGEGNPILAARFERRGDGYAIDPLDHERLEPLFPDALRASGGGDEIRADGGGEEETDRE